MEERLQNLYNYLLGKQVKNIALFDLSKEGIFFEYGIIGSIDSTLENKKVAGVIMQDFGLKDFPEGFNKGEWIIFDFGKIVVHLFTPEVREKYNLDKLWQSKKMIIDN